MGTDLFTSSRGPGVIGTLMALIVLIGFGVLYLFVFDERFQGGEKSLESIVQDDAQQLVRLEDRLAANLDKLEATKDFKKIAGELRSATTRYEILNDQREKLEATAAEAREQIAEFEKVIAKYQSAYRESARATMVGREMDELKTIDGKTYKRVKVTDIDPVRMQIRHQGGITGVALDTLPEEMQRYLQLDESEKERRLAAEAELREQQGRQADHGEALHRIATLEHKLSELSRERDNAGRLAERARDAAPQIESAIEAKTSELRREEAKASTGGISNAPQVRAEIQRLEGKLRYAREQGPALRAKYSALSQQVSALEAEIRAAKRDLEKKKAEPAE